MSLDFLAAFFFENFFYFLCHVWRGFLFIYEGTKNPQAERTHRAATDREPIGKRTRGEQPRASNNPPRNKRRTVYRQPSKLYQRGEQPHKKTAIGLQQTAELYALTLNGKAKYSRFGGKSAPCLHWVSVQWAES